ncbi:hypothetical protein D3800_12270 [Microcystis aeruginosa NIES-298]|uniref:Uncharacterized protein n=2 Tax=Microcystis aeruginosa TaxID=1126 RepID=A0A2H6BXX2_MICAE|nr:hypothetical protein [Microcystis aeruginosa]REJ52237.1 MAG: hypothetical protein DWQ56_23860 [Microcystis aeruginosa DA14]QHU84034.1 hypothetical protein D3800_12270 [Microcystis aeruginosa NIES-298]ROH99059.1 hypothetical protein ED562_15770 [Microcystis aeruginosa FACHB-524]GBD55045.1 unknown protein [Microcystis aeruginosa NIES-298]GBE97019.1 hypothetical protein NIES298_12680 [Microcystis aeruginosa NIES-298]
MKKINFILSIFILSQLGFSLPLKAQSRCQATINSIVNEIESKGVRKVIVEKGTVTNQGNPTNRKDELMLLLSSYLDNTGTSGDQRSGWIVSNIMASRVLMKSYADRIVSNCQDIAVVAFVAGGSDWRIEFAIQSDGKTQERTECIQPDDPLTPNWNQMSSCH